MNRPEKKNALTTEVCNSLVNAIEGSEEDPTVGAILLEARGDVFCAGMDLSEAQGDSAGIATAIHEKLFTLGLRLRKPIVASIQGPALGGGIGLIANAHIAIAAQGSSFGLTEIRVGMWPFVIWRSVAAAIGERRAMALALTGRIFSVNEALSWGLVHEVTPAFELDDRATATAHHLAESSAVAIQGGMEYVREARTKDLTEAGLLALSCREQVFGSADYREGVAAFREKRRPVWNR
jgi:enoyl-CoA hydratase/carnithine racemase